MKMVWASNQTFMRLLNGFALQQKKVITHTLSISSG